MDKDEVVGTIGIENYGKNRAYLRRMYIKKEFRGTGLADKMFSKALTFAKKNNFEIIYLSTSKLMTAANKFYKKNNLGVIKSLPSDLPMCGDDIFYKLKI